MVHSLFVSRLTLTDFRNHAALDLELDARPVCLFGPNGAGKTNVLEALSMLAPGRGLRLHDRGASDRRPLATGSTAWARVLLTCSAHTCQAMRETS